MIHDQIRSLQDAFIYMLDCNLATVVHLAMLKRKSKSEYQRQIGIAQEALDNYFKFAKDVNESVAVFKETRAFDVWNEHDGNVSLWAKQWEPL